MTNNSDEISKMELYLLREIATRVHRGSRLSINVLKHENRGGGITGILAHLSPKKPRCFERIGIVYSALPITRDRCEGCCFSVPKSEGEGDYICELGIDPTQG